MTSTDSFEKDAAIIAHSCRGPEGSRVEVASVARHALKEAYRRGADAAALSMRERAAKEAEEEARRVIGDIVEGDKKGTRYAHERASELFTFARQIRALPLLPAEKEKG